MCTSTFILCGQCEGMIRLFKFKGKGLTREFIVIHTDEWL
jgi:hypothetical protein